MRYLGLDYGEKRIGLAVGDSERRIAVPLGTVVNDERVFRRIKEIVETESVVGLVMGVPVSFSGQENAFAKVVRNFGRELARLVGRKIEFVNEVFSSKMASQNSEKVDESSAALILQSFLDRP